MDNQDSKKISSLPGQEHHGLGGVHLCQRCGWSFPNPHPSAKQRRSHKKSCGTIEGYNIDSKENPQNVSDDDDDPKISGPKLMKKTSSMGSGSMGSNRSDYEVFSDAVQEFVDAGPSLGNEEQLGNVRESVPMVTLSDTESVATESTVIPKDVTVPPSSSMDTKSDFQEDEKNLEANLPVSFCESAKEKSEEGSNLEVKNGIDSDEFNVAQIEVSAIDTLDFASKDTIEDLDAEKGNTIENLPEIKNENFFESNQDATMNKKDGEKGVVAEEDIAIHNLSDKLGSTEDKARIISEKSDTDDDKQVKGVMEDKETNPRNVDLSNLDDDHEKETVLSSRPLDQVSDSGSIDIDTSQLAEILKNLDDEDSKEEAVKTKTGENEMSKDPLLAPVEPVGSVQTCVNVEDDQSCGKKVTGVVSVPDVAVDSLSQTDSLEGNWGSVSGLSNLSEVVAKKTDSMETLEPLSEIQTAKTYESQGRQKSEEIIEKVKNWSDGKQHTHTPLKSLLGEAKSESKQIPKENSTKKNGDLVTTVNSILGPDSVDAEYRSEIKREKRKVKGRPFWLPFGCCSSDN